MLVKLGQFVEEMKGRPYKQNWIEIAKSLFQYNTVDDQVNKFVERNIIFILYIFIYIYIYICVY